MACVIINKDKINNPISYTHAVIPPTNPPFIVDTGATSHYIIPAHQGKCTNVQRTQSGPLVAAASGDTMRATHKATLPLSPHINIKAQTGHILDSLQTGSLISIGQLCDDNCVVIFTKNNVFITKNGITLISGYRSHPHGLYTIPFLKPTHQANSVIQNYQTKRKLAQFLHGAAFSPTTSTFLRAIQRGHFITWTGLTTELVTKNLPKAIMATNKGHLRGQQQNIQSTKLKIHENAPLPVSEDIASV